MSKPFVTIEEVNARYGAKQVLFDVSLEVPRGSIYAFIGPSGCGKTTLLRSINRLNDLERSYVLSGGVTVDGEPVYQLKKPRQIQELRRQIGMIFQRPNPLPMTILQNMIFPYAEHIRAGVHQMTQLAVEKLKLVGLFDEVGDRLHQSALDLSGGQQQRLCIARALMLPSRLMLFDEPCSALDPVSTFQIEELLHELKRTHTIVMVTHNMEQARRVSDYTAFFYEGKVIEAGETQKIFSDPSRELTQKYIRGVM